MKILVFSDSHNDILSMEAIINACKVDVSLIIHLGDLCSDFNKVIGKFPDIRYISVKGNNDFFELGTDSEYIGNFDGLRFFCTHGHQYSVKSGIAGISVRARALKADVVLFGHTHIPFKEKRGQTLFFNPGAIGCGNYTFGILQTQDSNVLSADILKYDAFTKQIDFVRHF